MGLNIQLDYEVPFNPNLNPLPALRAYPGLTSNLIAAFHLDYNPSPFLPVAGSHDETLGVPAGGANQVKRGYAFRSNDLINSLIVPGSDLTELTMYAIGRRTGYTPGGASASAGLCCVGLTTSAGFRIDLTATRPVAGNAIPSGQTASLEADTSAWDFYAFSVGAAGCKLYRPRITPTPVTDADTVASIGAAQLDNPFRIGTGGSAITWSESEVMAAGIFGAQLSDADVIDQYEAYQAYAAALGVTI